MKKYYKVLALLVLALGFTIKAVNAQDKGLKLVFIRHAERPGDGDNLNCKGFNRSMMLPALIMKKFGKPDNIYVPELNSGKSTKRGRMFQTISPFAIKYNLPINTKYGENDYKDIGHALLKEEGTVLIVWEHNTMLPILNYLGVKTDGLNWPDSDFDSIWIVTFKKDKAILTKDREGLNPQDNCSF